MLQLLFPSKCVLCGRIMKQGTLDLCPTCWEKVPMVTGRREKRRYLQDWTALWYYEGQVRESLLRYKFSNRRSYARTYGRLLAMRIQKEFPEDLDVLTWIPVSGKRRRRRGYDQVKLLTRWVGRELDKPVLGTLRKIRDNPAQSTLKDEAARRANVLGAYEGKNVSQWAGKRILLLDDVITTGATMQECARVLLSAGAEAVYGAAVTTRKTKKEQSKR